MPVIIINKTELEKYPHLRRKLSAIAESTQELDQSILFTTESLKLRDFIEKLKPFPLEFSLKN